MLNSTTRVQKYRRGLREAGYRQIQIWVPDIRKKEFIAECAKQVALVNAADQQDKQIQQMMDRALADLADSQEWM